MSKITCSRKIHICTGHRVLGHESKCANPHGHNYVIWIEAEAPLDSLGRVIDFSVLKQKVGGWLEEKWDHTFLVNKHDDEMLAALESVKTRKKDHFVCDFNPTAENMAEYLLKTVCPEVLKDTGVTAVKITIWETENCTAEAKLDV